MPRARTKYADYLGDAVCADFDGYHIVLTTEDGITITNRICLEPSVVASLERYVERLKATLVTESEAKHGTN